MKLNVWKNQTEIAKTFECNSYDLMYGTVEDILGILEGLDNSSTDDDLIRAVTANRSKLDDLILDVFPDMTEEDLRGIKVKELIPFFLELFDFVKNSVGGSSPKN